MSKKDLFTKNKSSKDLKSGIGLKLRKTDENSLSFIKEDQVLEIAPERKEEKEDKKVVTTKLRSTTESLGDLRESKSQTENFFFLLLSLYKIFERDERQKAVKRSGTNKTKEDKHFYKEREEGKERFEGDS